MRISLPLLLAFCLLLVAGAAVAQPYYAPGSYQGWTLPQDAPQMVDDGTSGDLVSGDGIYSVTVNIALAGAYEWKAATTDWASAWPGSGNCWFITDADNQDVLFTFDTNAYGDGWAADSFWPDSDKTTGGTYTVVGDLQSEIGAASDWDPTAGTILHDDGLDGDGAAGDGIYTLKAVISAVGSYQWKVAVNAGWAQQFGTDGPSVNASTWAITTTVANEEWYFLLDANTGRIQATMNAPVPVQEKTWGAIKALY